MHSGANRGSIKSLLCSHISCRRGKAGEGQCHDLFRDSDVDDSDVDDSVEILSASLTMLLFGVALTLDQLKEKENVSD